MSGRRRKASGGKVGGFVSNPGAVPIQLSPGVGIDARTLQAMRDAGFVGSEHEAMALLIALDGRESREAGA